MKTHKNLYAKLVDRSAIRRTIVSTAKGKAKRNDVAQVLGNLDCYVDTIYADMSSMAIPNERPKTRKILEYGKERLITINPFYPNQIYDAMLGEVLEKVVVRSIYRWSVGNLKGRGIADGKRYVEKNIGRYKYCLKMDIRKFYDSIDKARLLAMLRKRISDEDFIQFYESIIGCEGRGLELGRVSSQYLANYYLLEFDHFVKQKLKAPCYVRYVDDFVILANNKMKIHNYLRKIAGYLRSIGLELNRKWQILNLEKGDEVSFLGYRFTKSKTLIRKPTFHRFGRLAKRIERTGVATVRQGKRLASLYGWIKSTKAGFGYIRHHVVESICLKRLFSLCGKGRTYLCRS